MADGVSVTVANAMLTTMTGTDANDAQLHIGPPGSAGTANPSSVTTREAVTWGTAGTPVAAQIAASNQPQWASWAGTNGEVITDLSFWSASTSGTFGLSMPLAAPVTMDTGDSLTLTAITASIPPAS